jgi:hypothetical protein
VAAPRPVGADAVVVGSPERRYVARSPINIQQNVLVETMPVQHSPDGVWWWSGEQWLPAWSPDRRWWFDGVTWTPAISRLRTIFGRFDRRLAIAWAVAFVVALVWAFSSGPHVTTDDGLTGPWFVSFVVVFLAWLLGTIVTGYMLARRQRLLSLLMIVPLIWFLMGLWVGILGSMQTPASQPGDDNGAAVGVVLLAVPALLVLALLAALGVLVGWLVNRTVRRFNRTP